MSYAHSVEVIVSKEIFPNLKIKLSVMQDYGSLFRCIEITEYKDMVSKCEVSKAGFKAGS